LQVVVVQGTTPCRGVAKTPGFIPETCARTALKRRSSAQRLLKRWPAATSLMEVAATCRKTRCSAAATPRKTIPHELMHTPAIAAQRRGDVWVRRRGAILSRAKDRLGTLEVMPALRTLEQQTHGLSYCTHARRRGGGDDGGMGRRRGIVAQSSVMLSSSLKHGSHAR
jgi:hypothetical protein